MLAFRYISFHYLKYFFVILIALTMFVIGFDYMEHADGLPESANLVLIYLTYRAFFAIDMLLPLALVFGMIATKIFLIRSNALVSFYSLGYSRLDVLKPFVVIATAIIMLYISLHSLSNFSRASEYSSNIKKNSEYLSATRDLFFTYKNQYVYFAKMLPLQEKAEGIRVFSVKENSLHEVLIASSAVYRNDFWVIQKADVITKPEKIDFVSSGIVVDAKENLQILEGFRPKILDQVYVGKVNFTIVDAFEALMLLQDQNINTSTIKSALYKIFIYPFFVPCLVVIIFFFVPISPRFLNVSLFSFGAILATLLIWGVLYMFSELANNKTIPSEAGIIAPVGVLFLAALLQWRRHLRSAKKYSSE